MKNGFSFPFISLALGISAMAGFPLTALAAPIKVDFETGDLGDWKVVQGEFGKLISDAKDYFQSGPNYNKEGKYHLTTLHSLQDTPDDRYTGVVQSPLYLLKGSDITLLVGGGSGGETYVAVYDETGKELARTQGGNKEAMDEQTLKLPDMVGKNIFFRIVDQSMGGWGHITADNIRFDGELAASDDAYWKKCKPKAPNNGEGNVTTDSLRRAIEDLRTTYGDKYPNASKHLAALDKIDPSDEESLLELAAVALKENPLLTAAPLLFISRPQYAPDHHNTETFFQTNEINAGAYRPGGQLKLLDIPTGKVTTLYDPGKDGMVRDPEVGFDGKSIVFATRGNIETNYHIATINADGSGFKELTGLPNVSDIDPLFLPDGDIVFTSTRQPKFCMCNRHIMGNLYRMGADGANPRPLGRSTLHEGHSSLLPDGRILYDRWEYVDRDFGSAQGLWTVNPDGTNHVIYWGNNTDSPGGVIDARHIPGTQKVLAVLAACHDRPWGALGIIDRQKGLDGPDPVERTWPEAYRKDIKVDGWDIDSPGRLKVRYEDPYPLSDKYFLASRTLNLHKLGEKTGLYLVDTFGNEILLHAEADDKGSYDPMPLAPRTKPNMAPSMVDYAKNTGVFFLQNVYEGTHMAHVKPGEIKFIRIVESPEKRAWTNESWNGQGAQAPAMNWHSFENKRILGIVPVEADGSACFEIPANTFVYFQALDKDGRMVQSMRSGTIVQPGERQSCVGCHEDRLSSPPANMGQALASRRPPSKMTGRNGKTAMFNFVQDVQPIFDKHCLSCHDFGKKGAEKLVLAGDLSMPFNISYSELWMKGYTACVGGGNAPIRESKSWGSHKSPLIKTLLDGHNNVKLSKDDMNTLCTWFDINGIYYPYYETSYPDGVFGRGPLTTAEYNTLQQFAPNRPLQNLVSFTRPELSPILKDIKNPEDTQKVLALLKEGQARLKKTPRAEMKGFAPCTDEQNHLRDYSLLGRYEDAVRKAVSSGSKLYDRDFEKIPAPKK